MWVSSKPSPEPRLKQVSVRPRLHGQIYCSCNICIHHIPVVYAGGRATHGRQTAPAFAAFSTSCTSAVAESLSKDSIRVFGKVCKTIPTTHQPHLLSPQFRHVIQPSINTTALVWHLPHKRAFAGKAPSSSISAESVCMASNSLRLASRNFL